MITDGYRRLSTVTRFEHRDGHVAGRVEGASDGEDAGADPPPDEVHGRQQPVEGDEPHLRLKAGDGHRAVTGRLGGDYGAVRGRLGGGYGAVMGWLHGVIRRLRGDCRVVTRRLQGGYTAVIRGYTAVTKPTWGRNRRVLRPVGLSMSSAASSARLVLTMPTASA